MAKMVRPAFSKPEDLQGPRVRFVDWERVRIFHQGQETDSPSTGRIHERILSILAETQFIPLHWRAGPYRRSDLKRQGSSHEIWTNGDDSQSVPRHKEINEITASKIIKRAKEGNRK